MALDYERFMVRQSEWRGEVTNKLDNINLDVVEIKTKLIEFDKKLDKMDSKINNNRIKMAGIGATVSLIVTILVTHFLGGVA